MKARYLLLAVAIGMMGGCPFILQNTPSAAQFPSGANVFSDDNRERLINREGSPTVIDVGDSIRGILTINQLANSSGYRLVGGESQTAEITAIFQVLVLQKTETAIPGTFSFTFGPDPEFIAETQAPTGTIICAFTDSTNNVVLDGTSLAASEASAEDGSLFLELGFTGGDGAAATGEGWIAMGADDGGIPISPGEIIGTANFAVSRTSTNGTGGALNLTRQTSLFFGEGAEFIGGTAARGTVGLDTEWSFSSDTTIVMIVAE
jgi:hypothetical protein